MFRVTSAPLPRPPNAQPSMPAGAIAGASIVTFCRVSTVSFDAAR
jgi:hypothetical protein